MDTFRLLIIGAGFSKPAGLPLADQLFQEVRGRVKKLYGSGNQLERDLQRYFDYLHLTEGFNGSIDDIDIEQFLSFLDIEHYLGLKGSDTWSVDGNETQLLIRHTIGYVLLEHTPKKIPEIYKRFASKLNPFDRILTFNYDTLLEQALEAVGKPYRLFPDRFSEVRTDGIATIVSSPEVVLLKMHGSIDWFHESSSNSKHPLYGHNSITKPEPIANGPRFPDDPLTQIYRVKDPTPIYDLQWWECSPFLLSPSHSKLLYAKPLGEFWSGLSSSGGLNLGFGVIGYSLPIYDDYAHQAIYGMARNYQEYVPNFELGGRTKQPVRILDYRPTAKERTNLRKRYRFLEAKRTEYWYDGLSESGIEWFMT